MNDETYEFEDRIYVSPTISRDEQLAFINNLRSAQDTANQQIETQTRNLGTQVPLNQGGLTSGATDANSYWMSRYQTPQVNQQVANLQEAAQRTAMNQVLKNMADQMTNRYNQAYQDLRRRQYDLAQRKYDLTSRQYEMNKRQYEQSKRHYEENKRQAAAQAAAQNNYYDYLKSLAMSTTPTDKQSTEDALQEYTPWISSASLEDAQGNNIWLQTVQGSDGKIWTMDRNNNIVAKDNDYTEYGYNLIISSGQQFPRNATVEGYTPEQYLARKAGTQYRNPFQQGGALESLQSGALGNLVGGR